ncbi:MAG: GNAT family N-acetyltransferase [Thermodesulfobacteriota bacterium]
MEWVFHELSEQDRIPVVDLFNHYIENTFAAFPEKMVDYSFFDVFRQMTAGFPAVSVRTTSDVLIGFGFLRPYHILPAFRQTAEITYFLHPDSIRRQIGTRLLAHLEDKARGQGLTSLLASISSLNPPSIRFHEKNGFTECGRFLAIGVKKGRPFDVIWMQKRL